MIVPFEVDYPGGVYGNKPRLVYYDLSKRVKDDEEYPILSSREATETEVLLYAIYENTRTPL